MRASLAVARLELNDDASLGRILPSLPSEAVA
jgi:hypothetical protein